MTSTVTDAAPRLRAESSTARLRNVDWVLALTTIGLSLLGLVAIYSATQASTSSTFVAKQAVFLVLGTVLMFLGVLVDYRELRNFLGLLCLLTIAVLVAVLTPLGTEVKGTKGWFQFAGFSFQPAEIAKLALIVALAAAFTGRGGSVDASRIAGALGMLGAVAVLVLLQGETGSVLVYCFIALGIFLVAGVPIRVLLLLVVSGVAVFALAFTSGILENYQKERLTAFIDQDADLQGANYNYRQSIVAVGSGGLTGQGYLEGPQTQLGFLPEQHTDFIFASIGEENGFVGTATVLGLQGLLLVRVFRNAQLARDAFGSLICIGVFSFLLFQIFQNAGMNLRLMPITGVPLPFVSYGGSSLLTGFLAVGLVQSVAVHRHRGSPV
ncbi:MAG: rod shape determining protein RodA [Acidimicrobiales bacterium]|jgi:rod shape determining protein RodA